MVTENDIKEKVDRNRSIPMNIILVKPITLSNKYEKNILNNTKSPVHKKFFSEHEESNNTTDNESETSQ
ncbi:16555_t:CDS:1, partial [Dentiscutata heterogama]